VYPCKNMHFSRCKALATDRVEQYGAIHETLLPAIHTSENMDKVDIPIFGTACVRPFHLTNPFQITPLGFGPEFDFRRFCSILPEQLIARAGARVVFFITSMSLAASVAAA
jgi:hypothetical protein